MVQGSIDNVKIPNGEALLPMDGSFDGKRLKCSALNERGQVVYETEAVNPLDVAYGPRINCTQQTVNKISQNFEITCFISKNPHPDASVITLKKPNGQLIINDTEGITWKSVNVRVSRVGRERPIHDFSEKYEIFQTFP